MRRIELSGKKGKGIFITVDSEDFEWLSKTKWYINQWGYISSGRSIFMHKLILEKLNIHNLKVDHIDGNKLNCQKSNLRIATQSQNLANRGKQVNNTSGFKGVWLHKINVAKSWRAGIKAKGKTYHLGLFKTKEEAAFAYNEAAKRYFGEFGKLNQIGGN